MDSCASRKGLAYCPSVLLNCCLWPIALINNSASALRRNAHSRHCFLFFPHHCFCRKRQSKPHWLRRRPTSLGSCLCVVRQCLVWVWVQAWAFQPLPEGLLKGRYRHPIWPLSCRQKPASERPQGSLPDWGGEQPPSSRPAKWDPAGLQNGPGRCCLSSGTPQHERRCHPIQVQSRARNGTNEQPSWCSPRRPARPSVCIWPIADWCPVVARRFRWGPNDLGLTATDQQDRPPHIRRQIQESHRESGLNRGDVEGTNDQTKHGAHERPFGRPGP